MSTYSNPLTDYSAQMEFSEKPAGSFTEPRGVVLSEGDEMKLAADFLGIRNDSETEQFLGDLIHIIGHSLGPSNRLK
jgi:hypothetical protein